MPVVRLRNLSQYGIITDLDPYDLPPTAFSAGVNLRFANGRIEGSPVFRTAGSLTTSNPRFLVSQGVVDTFDKLFVCFKDGSVKLWSPSAGETDYSIAAYVPTDSEGSFSSTVLSEVLYVNRSDRVPWALTPGTSQFVALANWDAGWRCGVLRAFKSALVALNVTKAGVAYPTMVKTSDFALSGAVPASWDDADPSTNAYENILAEMDGSITDGRSLGENFFIYSPKETWVLQQTGGSDIYAVRRLFNDAGAINTNCVVEVDSKHYVFGLADIWVHDGQTKQSLTHGRVHDWIYNSLNASASNRCFVMHDLNLKEIRFFYTSSDRLTGFSMDTTLGANRAAVFNYVDSTWTFYDAPYVWPGDISSIDAATTWDASTSSWDTFGGSWLTQADGFKKGVVLPGDTASSYSITEAVYAHDPYNSGSVFAFPVDPNANPGTQVERDGIDLDDLGEELRDYKNLTAVWPEARVADDTFLEFSFGGSDSYNEVPEFSDFQTYDGKTLNKLDVMAYGRYLSMKAKYDSYKDFTVSGIDLNLYSTGKRG